jgi:hypothetical protein
MLVNKYYYAIKPLIPRRLQIALRRLLVQLQLKQNRDVWPIDHKASMLPKGWVGWPDSKKFALVLTHDVDTARGQDRCMDLMSLEMRLGFRSSFNFVPERYNVSTTLRKDLILNGFEVGVHGLYHDGKYYESRTIFQARALRINHYLKEWHAVGFRSPSMLHNLEWIHDLNIEYDASTFDTDPFEPQSEGMGTIFPFWVGGQNGQKGYVELPYTLPQDFTIFVLLKRKDISIWKQKLDWVAKHGGMVLINVHPDYLNFRGDKSGFEEYTAEYYQEMLAYISSQYHGQYWHVLPKDIARFWSMKYGSGLEMKYHSNDAGS